MSLNIYKKKKTALHKQMLPCRSGGNEKIGIRTHHLKRWESSRFIGNLRPMTQKTLRGMRTRAKKKHVASDRARHENVPRHILF